MKKTMQVQGMSCGHCKQSVESAINGIDGVSEAKVNLSTGEVEIYFDDSKVTTKQLKATVEEQGYDVLAP